jgi:hypothetical protein
LGKFKAHRLFKCIDKGFVPSINELNQVGVELSGTKSNSVFYTSEHAVTIPSGKIFHNEPLNIPRTFHRAAEIKLSSTYLDNDTYGNKTSIDYSHLLDLAPDATGKVYCIGSIYHSHDNPETQYIMTIRNVIVPISFGRLLALVRTPDAVLELDRQNHIFVDSNFVSKKLGTRSSKSYHFGYTPIDQYIPDARIRDEFERLKDNYSR